MLVAQIESLVPEQGSQTFDARLRHSAILTLPRKIGLAVLILLAATEFTWRGPVRSFHATDLNDFVAPYVQTRLLLRGLDPYSPENLVRHWPEGARRPDFLIKELVNGSLIVNRGIPTAYPLTSFVLLTPFAIFRWRVAYFAWILVNVLLTFWMIRSLVSLAGLRRDEWQLYVFITFALALAPFHTGLATGAIAIPAAALSGIGFSLANGRSGLAGILLGVAICLKPQIGLPFLLFHLLRRSWRLSGIAVAVVLIAASLATTWLAISHTPWLQNYLVDSQVLLRSGILSDFTERNPMRFGLVNLQVLLYALLGDRSVADGLAILVTASLSLVWFFAWRRRRCSDDLLALSGLLILSLLPVYHRFYDASLLVLPLCWSLREFSGRLKLFARRMLVLILPFLVPGGSVLEQLQIAGRVPAAVARSWWWSAMVMPHQIWILLVMSALLIWAMRHGASEKEPRDHQRLASA